MSDNLTEPTFDTEAARKVLENERADRMAHVGRELKKLLDDNHCDLVITVTYNSRQPQPVFSMQVVTVD